MICCDKCKCKKKATHSVGWVDCVNPLKFSDCIVLCDECYAQFMCLFGKFKGANK